jgi:HAE1 family hydrophobic/amphiphilic exporter-1
MTLERVYGPEQLTRYNMFTSSMINGEPAPGYSSGDAIAAVEETAGRILPRGYTFDWSGVTREEIKSGNQTLAVFLVCLFFVYLLLAAQYESYILPFAIVLSMPAGIFGSYLFLWATGLENNVYAQVALVMLIGLLAKNAILIVEFAIQRRKEGATILQAAIEGSVSRLRPILMTSFAFVAGLIPLCIATGAGAIGNRSIGTAAAGGMITGTLFGIFLVPGLYVIFESFATKIRMKRVVVGLILLVTVTSCKITSEVSEPSLTLPDSYFGEVDTTDVALIPWAVFYKDSSLVRLIETALENNRDMRMSTGQLELALADYKMQSKNYLPAVDITATNALKRFGTYTMDGVGNEDTNESERVPADKKIPMSPYREWYGGLAFSWEADIWGKLFSQRKAAMARYMASGEYRHGMYTWLVGEVASNYFELMGLDQEKKVLQENLRLQEVGLEMMRVQKAGGNVNQLAVDQFEAQLLNVKSQLVGVEREIIVTEGRINELLGRFPHRLVRDSISGYDDLQLPPVGMPEQLLKRRPDIRQAELELAAANWDVNVARTAFYPSLQISGLAGFQSFDFSKWLSPASAAYNIASGISAPIFRRRQVRAMYDAANARQRVLLGKYERALLTGYYEVYVTITTFENLDERIELKRSEVEVLRQAYNNANDLFSVGYATYLEVITAQRRMLEVELEYTRLKKQKLMNLALLYRALGGGWESD